MTRFARRVDANQSTIVAALRAAGAAVKVVHQPFDLQVWAPNGKTMYQEVKNPKTGHGKRGMNAKQAQEAQGLPVAMVDSVEAALRAYRVLAA
jgi:hypothetical protein